MIRRLSKAFCKAKLYILAIPCAIWLAGIGMNQAVLVANGGRFPFLANPDVASNYVDDIHCVMTEATHLNFLGDYINFYSVILSPGDVLIDIGNALSAYASCVWATVVIMTLVNNPY